MFAYVKNKKIGQIILNAFFALPSSSRIYFAQFFESFLFFFSDFIVLVFSLFSIVSVALAKEI